MRKALGEALVRLVLLVGAGALLRWATVASNEWREELSATAQHAWGGWAEWIAIVAAAGVVTGLACLTGRPGGYRVLVPLVISLPPVVLLGHFVLVIENAGPGGQDLPWILDHLMFYMELPSQFVLAFVVGLGIAAGFRPAARAEVEPARIEEPLTQS